MGSVTSHCRTSDSTSSDQDTKALVTSEKKAPTRQVRVAPMVGSVVQQQAAVQVRAFGPKSQDGGSAQKRDSSDVRRGGRVAGYEPKDEKQEVEKAENEETTKDQQLVADDTGEQTYNSLKSSPLITSCTRACVVVCIPRSLHSPFSLTHISTLCHGLFRIKTQLFFFFLRFFTSCLPQK